MFKIMNSYATKLIRKLVPKEAVVENVVASEADDKMEAALLLI